MTAVRRLTRQAALAAGALAAAAAALAAQAEPRVLGEGVLSTPANEFGGALTPDGREIYFSISVPVSYRYAIYVSRLVRGAWTTPALAPFSGYGRDFDPVLSPDGRRMLFISDRPAVPGRPKRDYDVWMVERTPGGAWGAPRNLGAPVNGTANGEETNEVWAAFAPDGSLYIAADSPQGMAIYESQLVDARWAERVPLGPSVNAGAFTGEPFVAPDGSFLLYAAYGRRGGYGGWDLYISPRLPDGTWGEGENLGPRVNTPQRDYSPRLMPDGHTLIFTSERYFAAGLDAPLDWKTLSAGLRGVMNGHGNLYTVDLRSLGLRSLR